MAMNHEARWNFYTALAYQKWAAQFGAGIRDVMSAYAAECAKVESIRRRLRGF